MNTQRGFTLVEILVALVLFATVGGALLSLFQQGLRTARIAADRAHAAMLARSMLTELQAYKHLHPGTLEGKFKDDFRWHALLTKQNDSAKEPLGGWRGLDLQLTVSWGEAGETNSFELQSVLLSRAGNG